ncbi:putative ATP-binding protein [Escherichia coli]|nr:putative ATP-binding protein [Escherichia coli]
MKRLKNELNALVNRGVDRHLRLAVTGLSRSGKTAFITADGQSVAQYSRRSKVAAVKRGA